MATQSIHPSALRLNIARKELDVLKADLAAEAGPLAVGVPVLLKRARYIFGDLDWVARSWPDVSDRVHPVRDRLWADVCVRLDTVNRERPADSDRIDLPLVQQKLGEIVQILTGLVADLGGTHATGQADDVKPPRDDTSPPSTRPPGPSPRTEDLNPRVETAAYLLFDLSRYTAWVAHLVRRLGNDLSALPGALNDLNEQLVAIVEDALRATRTRREPHRGFVFAHAGDAMLMRFERVTGAVRCAASLHTHAERHNDRRRTAVRRAREHGLTDPEGRVLPAFHFRVGVGYGPVRFEPMPEQVSRTGRSYPVALGLPLIHAQRLSAAATTGEVLVHHQAWAEAVREDPHEGDPPPWDLPAALLDHWESDVVPGKWDEEDGYPTMRRRFAPRAPWDTAPPPWYREVIDRLLRPNLGPPA